MKLSQCAANEACCDENTTSSFWSWPSVTKPSVGGVRSTVTEIQFSSNFLFTIPCIYCFALAYSRQMSPHSCDCSGLCCTLQSCCNTLPSGSVERLHTPTCLEHRTLTSPLHQLSLAMCQQPTRTSKNTSMFPIMH